MLLGALQQGILSPSVSTDVLGKTRLVSDIRMPTFNIITGKESAGTDRNKYWNGQQMDYRRRR